MKLLRDRYPFKSIPAYSTDPAADYEVLKRVRETWRGAQRERFNDALIGLWSLRATAGTEKDAGIQFDQYEPGDWSRGALAALDGEGKCPCPKSPNS